MPASYVALFGFLLASFPIRSSTIWGTLASGRELARGQAPSLKHFWAPEMSFGEGWLFDLFSYTVYSLAGGAGLVVVKALVVAGVAVLLFRTSKRGVHGLLALLCTGLALLAASTRIHFGPTILALLFFSIILAVAWTSTAATRRWFVPRLSLALVFLLWANVDRSVLVGLVALALIVIGKRLDARPINLTDMAKELLAVIALAAICMLTPAHRHGIAWPSDLTARGPFLGSTQSVVSPFTSAYFEAAAESPAALAFFALIALSAVSFVLVLPRLSWARLLPWLALAGLSAYQVRMTPYFALVAGPVLAWNLSEFFARRARADRPLVRSRGGRIALAAGTYIVALCFLACAWPGWLQGPPFEPRRWEIETPKSLQECAEQFELWHKNGVLAPESVSLHVSKESVATFAWYAPGCRSLLDAQLLGQITDPISAPEVWAGRLRDLKIGHLIVYDADRQRTTGVCEALLADAEQWSVRYLNGSAAIFSWHDPFWRYKSDAPATDRLDWDRLAIHPAMRLESVPNQNVDERRWWEVFWKRARSTSDERDAATFYLIQAESNRRIAPVRHLIAWEATQVAGLVAAAANRQFPTALADVNLRLVLQRPRLNEQGRALDLLGQPALLWREAFAMQRDDTGPAVLYLAIRSARTALAQNPKDARAYTALGEAYLRLLHSTRERAWSRRFDELAQLRRAQAVFAFTQAVTLQPDLAAAHYHLAALYSEMDYLDLALQHQRAYVSALRRGIAQESLRTPEVRDMLGAMQEQVDRLADLVDRRERAFEERSPNMRVLDRATTARDLGLAGRARDILLKSDISAFGANGMALELELLLRTGRARDVRNWTSPEQQAALGPLYHWLRAQALAATGEYDLAGDECNRMGSHSDEATPVSARVLMAGTVSLAILDGYQSVANRPQIFWRTYGQTGFRRQLGRLIAAIRREADALVLHGLLMFEAGDTEAATVDFRRAMATWGGEDWSNRGGIDFSGYAVADAMVKWFESVPKPQ